MSAYDQALARFEHGTADRSDVQTLVDHSGDVVRIQIRVKRSRPPRHRQPIHLLGRGSPLSDPDRDVVPVHGSRRRYQGVWAAWWRVADLRLWLRKTEDWVCQPEERAERAANA